MTERLVKLCLEDTIKVVIDYASEPSLKKRKKIDTGLYECIYRAKNPVEKPQHSAGTNLEVKGKQIRDHLLKKY